METLMANMEAARAYARQVTQKHIGEQERAESFAVSMTGVSHQLPSREVVLNVLELASSREADNRSLFCYLIDYSSGPPSQMALQDLCPMGLTDLKIRLPHQVKVLCLRQFGPLVRQPTTTMAGVEDEYGNVAVLHINTHDRPDVDVLPLGSVIAIKEPRLDVRKPPEPGDQLPCFLTVEHISDLIILHPLHQLTPLAFRQASVQPETEQTALEWKSLGNTALKANSMQLARNYYSAGLAVAGSHQSELKHDLLRNRALANLNLGRCDAALADALASISEPSSIESQRLNFKAYHRAGRAEYLLDWWWCRRLDWAPKSRRKAGKGRRFLSKVDVMPSELHGRGLFANRDIVPGELVMCEKAISIVYGDLTRPKPVLKYLAHKKECKVTGNLAGAHRQLAKKLSDNLSLITKVLELYAGKDYDAETKELIQLDETAVVDSYLLHEICANSGDSCAVVADTASVIFPFHWQGERHEEGRRGVGLWCMASYINHSCMPNSSRSFIGDLMITRATKPIARDQEITRYYQDFRQNLPAEDLLRGSWDFAEARREWGKVQADALGDIRTEMLASYTTHTKSYPRPAMLYLYGHLAVEKVLGDTPEEAALDICLEWLRYFGLVVTIQGETVKVDRTLSTSHSRISAAYLLTAKTMQQTGRAQLGQRFVELAKEAYLIYNGTMHGMSSSEETPSRDTPTTPLYQTDETLRTHLTRVTAFRPFADLADAERDLFKAIAGERENDSKCFIVETKETIFYPQGGGQPFDTGVITVSGRKFNVEAVRNAAGGRALHFGTWEDDSTFQTLAAGDMVEQHIDGARRDLNSRSHTAGHVVSLAVRRMVEQGVDLDVIDQKASHIPGACFVEFKGLIDGKFKDEIQSQTTKFVKQALPVKLYWLKPEELGEKDVIISEGMPVVSGHDGLVRIVDIVGAGAYPCGGTHTPNTSACGEIVITRIKRQKGMSKVSYTIL
ncbi:unnamed protein product [Zymoseptoria tritici ST99CH_1A5]|uniref:SET domain-containing protein n=2 Tax=Zymoseptoria tritici TaxID=1047171 RepID=A0A1Y6LEA7_ZYMTR|nr:unnamed protein product [Zymoseptoria tritici ST99CH_1A5]